MNVVEYERHAPRQLLPFTSVLTSLSDDSFIVGGAVRDMLMGKTPKDWDLVTDTPMDVLECEFIESGFEVKLTGVAHFVLNVYKNDYCVEVSNFRKDVVCDGRQAEVEVGTIHDDAHRRDLTINSLYVNLKTGRLLDPTGLGLSDVMTRTVRFVGKPNDRIREDWLRAFRIRRFVGKGMTPEKKSLRAARELWNEAYTNTTPERVRAEIEKLVMP